ncbi:YlxR family protein [bacterium]|nr:YlxR family protein [bacterium]
MDEKKFLRQCMCCRTFKKKDDLIRLTKDFKTSEIKINTNNEIQGRSVYICKNKDCIEKAFKKNRIEVLLKSKLPEDVKIDLYTVLKK